MTSQDIKQNRRFICADPEACFFKSGIADSECIGCPRLRVE
jgi:hypothetical protein